jgi:hypothetical protein
MAKLAFRLTNLPVATLAVVTAGVAVAALTLGNGDALVERGFERAIASMAKQSASVADSADALADSADALGAQKLLLKRVAHDAGATFTKPVTVGDRITITSDGNDRILNVVTVDKLDSSIIPTSSERPTQLLLVTCRDEAKPEARPVRFLIEADEELPALSTAKRIPSKV